jgi:hypothetical protein
MKSLDWHHNEKSNKCVIKTFDQIDKKRNDLFSEIKK